MGRIFRLEEREKRGREGDWEREKNDRSGSANIGEGERRGREESRRCGKNLVVSPSNLLCLTCNELLGGCTSGIARERKQRQN